ncbi:hypothetical protein NQ318_017273 [Aromia moschata]|uniref:Redoxin domain-containing protein n=1 Tax=Aromia moschata TaxID=1265417 RepID=A0AAV8X0K5_9CUCU|nr:hypothetical protein NQ318_017273 [Aromia moschata]
MNVSSIARLNKPIHFVFQRFLQTSSTTMVKRSCPQCRSFQDLPTNKVNLAQLTAGKKVIVLAVPGAFTPGCSKTHLPGFVNKSDELKSQGLTR